MVDDGRKIYRERNATDAETGRTISTPELTEGWAERVGHPHRLAFAILLAALLVIGIVVFVEGWVPA